MPVGQRLGGVLGAKGGPRIARPRSAVPVRAEFLGLQLDVGSLGKESRERPRPACRVGISRRARSAQCSYFAVEARGSQALLDRPEHLRECLTMLKPNQGRVHFNPVAPLHATFPRCAGARCSRPHEATHHCKVLLHQLRAPSGAVTFGAKIRACSERTRSAWSSRTSRSGSAWSHSMRVRTGRPIERNACS
jgi:hypothetical protein